MAYYSKYTGAELEERLDKVEEIPQLIAQMITGKDFVTKEDLLCVLKDYAPADYRTIPIDNNTIYWENGVLKAATSEGGQCQWELREHNGIQYLYSRLPVVTQYDVTMYADVNHLDLPSIYDGLPIDGDTIYWEETENGRILKSKYEGSSGVDASEVLSIVSGAGYATQNWVNNQSFITQSYLATELLKYVTLDNYQEIIGVKNFLNGIQISDLPITKLEGYEDVIYIDANVVVRGGLTMYYEDGEINLPSIKEEIGNAGYDGAVGLASFNSSQFFISSDGTVTIIGGSAGLDTAQLAEYLTTNKYATQGWITEQNYASASNLTALQSKVDNFLEGSDSDTIINKWLELEAFLSGLSESDNLATILSNKANKSTTLAGYGITDAYTKTQLDNTFKLYIPIAGYTEITGEKNFTGGLRVNNSPVIYYDEDNKYWKLEGDLLVTGGVSMYSDDTDFIPSTIMDAVVVDGTSIRKNPTTGALEVIGGSGSTTKYPLSWSGLNQGYYDGSQAVSFYIPTKLSEFINDSSFATTSDLNNYQTKITSSNKLSYSLISGTPTSLPASDVYTWAKASVKPSYMWGEIGEKPTFANVATSGKYSDISGTPTSLKNPNSLKFGSKTYDGSSEQTILASDLGAITSHQTIYTLTFQSGTFSAGNFTANSAKQTINVPTTTSHISEGSNLYFTNARALSALKSTTDGLASDIATKWTQNDTKISNWDTAFGWGDHSKQDYTTNAYVNNTFVTLGSKQTITGEKNFTGGLRVNNSPSIYYDATNKYWKLEGDLLVTGGVSMYSDDTSYIPSTIMDAVVVDGVTIKKRSEDGALYFAGTMDGGVTDFWELNNIPTWIGSSKPTYTLGSLQNVDSSSIDATAPVDRVLFQSAGSATWSWKALSEIGGGSSGGGSVSGDYLPLTGGTIKGVLSIRRDTSVIHFGNSGTINYGYLGFKDVNTPVVFEHDGIVNYTILHSGNYSSYALPLSGGTITGGFGALSIKANNQWGSGVKFENNNKILGYIGFSSLNEPILYRGASADGESDDIIHSGNISSYNAGSATKLQTARTIWGQSFDGTGNVSGNISMGRNSIVFSSGRLGSHNSMVEANTTNIITWEGKDDSYLGYVGYYADHFIFCNYKGGTENSGFSVYDNGNITTIGNGNFGIGTTNPAHPLHVIGDIGLYAPSTTNPYVSVNFACSANDLWQISGRFNKNSGIENNKLNIYYYNGSTYASIMTLQTSGNVGIGTTSPSRALHVKGSIVSEDGSLEAFQRASGLGNFAFVKINQYYTILGEEWPSLVISDYYGNNICKIGGFTHGMYFKSGRYQFDNFIFLDSQGNPVARLSSSNTGMGHHFMGNALFTGGITMYSDIRKKTKLQDVELSLSQIANAPLIEHYYNSDQNKTTHVGSIAQYWAGLNDWFCKLDNEGFYTMEIQNCALASAISIARELVKYESKTDKTIRKMKQRIEELENEVERLKNN